MAGNGNLGKQIEQYGITRLIIKYSIPAILSGLVNSVYNIVDQIFIGQYMGTLGNAATTVAFPFVTICTALAYLFGVGSAANFSISLGKGDISRAKKYIGNSLAMLAIISISMVIITLLFADQLLLLFGATAENFEYAKTYVLILCVGFPFNIFTIGTAHTIRADGSPKSSTACVATGAILNCFLNPIFIFGLNLGITGAAIATIIGQFVSFIMVLHYLFRFKSFKLTRDLFKLDREVLINTAKLGMAPCINQFAITVAQITMNNTLKYYGELSIYGADIPQACVGIISKINSIYLAITVGIGQGCQPIIGYNYGARRYDKVMDIYKRSVIVATIISITAFAIFQLFPRQLTSVFGTGTEQYFEFAENYFRVFMGLMFLNGFQPITGNFFTAIGKASRGALVALTKQIVFLVPLVIILPMFMGIDGVLYAGPLADLAAFTLAITFITIEFRELKQKINGGNTHETINKLT